jgi:hypothetical protein
MIGEAIEPTSKPYVASWGRTLRPFNAENFYA